MMQALIEAAIRRIIEDVDFESVIEEMIESEVRDELLYSDFTAEDEVKEIAREMLTDDYDIKDMARTEIRSRLEMI